MSASIEEIWNIVASRLKFVFTPTFIFCSPICFNNCGVVFFVKIYFNFLEMTFLFDCLNMQIYTVNITQVVWPHVTIPLDLWHFCQHNTLFYYLNLVPCLYWSWQRNIYFWWIFLSDILFPWRKVASNKESHNSGNINGENLHIWAVERKKIISRKLN